MSLYRLFRTSGYLSSSIIPVKNPEKYQTIKVPDTVGDDLDRFVENLKIGQIQEGKVDTLQFLQMTEDELKQFGKKDPEFLSSYAYKWTSFGSNDVLDPKLRYTKGSGIHQNFR